MNIDQLKKQNDLTAAECDALLKLILKTPNRLTDKYADVNAVHHYEVAQESGATTSFDNSHLIQVNSTTSGATAVTNYEYELREQHKKGRIRLIRREFLDLITDEFTTLIGA